MRTVELAPPVDAPVSGPDEDFGSMLELLPLPAAVIEIVEGRYAFAASNTPFRVAGLGVTAQESPVVRKRPARGVR